MKEVVTFGAVGVAVIVLVVAVQAGLFAGLSQELQGAAGGGPKPGPGDTNWVDYSAVLVRPGGWSLSVSAQGLAISSYSPHDDSGNTKIERGGDENPGTWHIDGTMTVVHSIDAVSIYVQTLEPKEIQTGNNGQGVYRVTFYGKPVFLSSPGQYQVNVLIHLWYTDQQGQRSGSQTISGYSLFAV